MLKPEAYQIWHIGR